MKRMLVLLMVLVVLAVQYPASAGILPSISKFSSPFPSLTDVTGKKPKESVVMPDGSCQDTYSEITNEDYEAFSAYLETDGFTLVSYETSEQVLSAILQRGKYTITFSFCSKDGTAILTYPTVDSSYFDDIVYISRLTGQPITAEPDFVKGFFSAEQYKTEYLLPFPVDWSQGKLSQIDMLLSSDGNTLYHFQAENRDETEKLMMEYIMTLSKMGFTCKLKEDFSHYYLSMENRPEIIIHLFGSEGDKKISCALPPKYSFEVKEADDPHEYRRSFTGKSDSGKEIYHFFFEDSELGSAHGLFERLGDGPFVDFELRFSPMAYHEGDGFSLQDFLNQSNSGAVDSLYYCVFKTKADKDLPYSTLQNGEYQTGSFAFFKELEVDVLRRNASETVLYYYVEVDDGAGILYKWEGLMDDCHETNTNGSSDSKSEKEYLNGVVDGDQEQAATVSQGNSSSVRHLIDCPSCRGKGYERCVKCSGSGKVRCTKCGGDGHSYNTVSKKEKKCTRCWGTGKQDCSSCTNGKEYCTRCGGTGHLYEE